MTPFREQNKTVIGAVGLTLILLLLAAAFNADSLPIIGGGTVYKAEFSEAAGLQKIDEVRVAGVKVGKVVGVDLAGDHVLVHFRVKNADFGKNSRADIRIKTVLGRKFLMLTPDGPGQLSPNDVIPLSRTSSPYDVSAAFQGLASTVDQIDTKQLERSFTTLADDFRGSPSEVRASLNGLSRLSNTIASRDAKLHELLAHAQGVTHVLASRDQDLVSFLKDSDLILQELRRRRAGDQRAAHHDDRSCPSSSSRWFARTAPPWHRRWRSLHDVVLGAARQPGQPRQGAAASSRPSSGCSPTTSATGAGSTPTSTTSPTPAASAPAASGRADEHPLAPARRSSLVALALAGSLSGCGVFGGGGTRSTSPPTSPAPSASTSTATCACSACKIGQVTKITPEGTKVHLDMEYDASYKIPADAKAVVVAPSIVSDRYVQLTPVWTSGPVLADKASIGLYRTAVPVELDQIYSNLDQLNQDLGPNGANKNGALSDLLQVGAENLKGNGGCPQRHPHRPVEGGQDPRRLAHGPVRHDQQPAAVHDHSGA